MRGLRRQQAAVLAEPALRRRRVHPRRRQRLRQSVRALALLLRAGSTTHQSSPRHMMYDADSLTNPGVTMR